MKRTLRWMLRLSAIVPLAAFVSVLVLWIPSYRYWWIGQCTNWHGQELSIRSSDGEIEFRRELSEYPPDASYWTQEWTPRPQPMDWSKIPLDVIGVVTDEMMWRQDFIYEPVHSFRWWQFSGYVGNSIVPADHGIRVWSLTVPDWSLAALTAALPAAMCASMARRLRRRWKGLCVKCGYDLRATPGRCPECGVPSARTLGCNL